MKWLSKIALSILALLTAVAAFLFGMQMQNKQRQRAEKAEAEVKEHREALTQIKERAEKLHGAASETVKVEEEANVEKKELAGTGDADLVHRANRLFGM